MTDPVISNVETIEHQDFESISEDVSHHRDDRDVVYMRSVTRSCGLTLPLLGKPPAHVILTTGNIR